MLQFPAATCIATEQTNIASGIFSLSGPTLQISLLRFAIFVTFEICHKTDRSKYKKGKHEKQMSVELGNQLGPTLQSCDAENQNHLDSSQFSCWWMVGAKFNGSSLNFHLLSGEPTQGFTFYSAPGNISPKMLSLCKIRRS